MPAVAPSGAKPMATVIIPANNEESFIGPCLDALLASDPSPGPLRIIVAANACRDGTVAAAQARSEAAANRGWHLDVLDLAEPGKLNALNEADAAAGPGPRIYLDADVTVSPPLLSQLVDTLDRPEPVYASGTIRIRPSGGLVGRSYARFWATVPFMSEGVPGCGLFAVNESGRARWGAFPDIISDDTYVRLLFAPHERHGVPAEYDWPIVAGFGRLVKVRRRQDRGVGEIRERFPELLKNDDKRPIGPGGLLQRLVRHPIGFAVYSTVALAVRYGPQRAGAGWTRGR
jgi:glycosyltransferase involved in cell wall biosynthesis